MFWFRQEAWPPPRQATRVRGDPTCQLASPAQSGAEAVVKDTSPDVEVQRQTVLTGGLLKKFPPEKTEFVRLKKDEKWLIHAVCGPMNRQCGLRRTKMVDDLITAALAAAEGESIARARARRRLRCRFQSPAERFF